MSTIMLTPFAARGGASRGAAADVRLDRFRTCGRWRCQWLLASFTPTPQLWVHKRSLRVRDVVAKRGAPQ